MRQNHIHPSPVLKNQPTLQSPLSIVAMIVIGVFSTSVLVSTPILSAAMATRVGGGQDFIGYLASADFFGMGVASATASFWVLRRFSRRLLLIILGGVFFGNIISIFVSSFAYLFALRFIIGCLNGLILSVVFVGLCRTRSPDRSFGIYVFVQLALQSVLIPLFSWIWEAYGASSLFTALALFPLLSIPLLLLFPSSIAQSHQLTTGSTKTTGVKMIWAGAALIGLFIYFLAQAGIWAYIEPIGQSFGVSGQEIGNALGLAAFAGMAGAATVLVIGSTISRAFLMSLGIGLSVIAVILLSGASGFLLYLLAASIFNFAWNFTFPYLMGVISLFDDSGEVAVLSLVAQLFGLALGPFIGALVVSDNEFGPLLSLSILVYCVSFAIFIVCNRVAAARSPSR